MKQMKLALPVVAAIGVILPLLIACDSESTGPSTGSQADTLMTFRRTACFRMCPVYTVTVYTDRTVIYFGERYIEIVGYVIQTLERQQLDRLIDAFLDIDFFSLQDRYVGYADGCVELRTDHPAVIMTFNFDGESKTVTHYHGCKGLPILDELVEFERRIDEIIGTSRWVG